METRIIQKEALFIVGLSLETLLQDEREQRNIPKLFDQFEQRVYEIKNRKSENTIGIFIDPPHYDHTRDPFKWITGVEVTALDDIPDGMEAHSIPANTYACTIYQGPKSSSYQAYDYLYQWVAQSDYELADTYGIEEYLAEADQAEGEQRMQLMLPVMKASIGQA